MPPPRPAEKEPAALEGGFASESSPLEFEGLLDNVKDLSFQESVDLFEGLVFFNYDDKRKDAETGQVSNGTWTTFVVAEKQADIDKCYYFVDHKMSPEIREEMKDIPRYRELLATIHAWTKYFCYIVNEKFRATGRNEQNLEPVLPFMKNLTKALHSLPSRLIVCKDLYRADKGVRNNWDSQVHEGGTLEYWTYMSFSTDPKVLETFFGDSTLRTFTHITNGIGYDIQPFSAVPRESEILTEAVTKIRVTEAEKYDASHKLVKSGQIWEGLHLIKATQEKGTSMLKGSPVRAKEEDHPFEARQSIDGHSTGIQDIWNKLKHRPSFIPAQLGKEIEGRIHTITADEDFTNVMSIIVDKMIIMGRYVSKQLPFLSPINASQRDQLAQREDSPPFLGDPFAQRDQLAPPDQLASIRDHLLRFELPAYARVGIGGALLLYGGHVKSSVAVLSSFGTSLLTAGEEDTSHDTPTLAIFHNTHARVASHRAGNFAGMMGKNQDNREDGSEAANRPLCQKLPKILSHPITQALFALSQRAQVLGLGLHFGWAMATRFGSSLERHLWCWSPHSASHAEADAHDAKHHLSITMDIAFLTLGMKVVYLFKQPASLWTSCCLLTDLLQLSELNAEVVPKLFSSFTFLIATGYSRICNKSIATTAWKLQGIGNLWLSCLLGSHLVLAGDRAKKTHFLWIFSGAAFLRQLLWFRTDGGAVPPFYFVKWIVNIFSKVEVGFKWFAPDANATYGSTSKNALVMKMQGRLDNAIDKGLQTMNVEKFQNQMASKVAQLRALTDEIGQQVDDAVKAGVGGVMCKIHGAPDDCPDDCPQRPSR